MRKRILILGVAALAWAPAAHADGPAVSVQATPLSGAAPLTVTFTASGDPAAYGWQFGDGGGALDVATVQHTYTQPGTYTATVTATGASGSSQASAEIAAYAVTLRAPGTVRYGHPALFRGTVQPAAAGAKVTLLRNGHAVASAHTRADGSFRIRRRVMLPGTYQTSYLDALSNSIAVHVKPVLRVRTAGSGFVGGPLAVVARLYPASAGSIRLRVYRNGKQLSDTTARAARIRLSTSGPFQYAVRALVLPNAGFVRASSGLKVGVLMPTLGPGSRGPSVRYLEQHLADLHYALAGVDGYYGTDTEDAVVAFQKVNWLERTGRVDRTVWRRLEHASIPLARYRSGSHFEVDKGRQVLLDVRAGVVARVIPVSTGATGNTPLGVFHVYDKTPGFNAKLMYYSMYFIGGFAIHGYPYVPTYPASHGCVRVPLWVAVSLYDTHPYGTTVIIY